MNLPTFNKLLSITLGFFLVSSHFFCSKKENQEDIQKYINNPNISDEEALYGISKVIFKDSLKSFKSEKNSAGKQDITIEYGGNRAYTFYSDGNYSERIQFDTVRYILLLFQSGEKRNLDSLRISLVKPFFVKEPDAKKELTEEFEVFRVSMIYSDVIQVDNWNNSQMINDKKGLNSKVTELFNQVRLRWKIELDELSRIELK